MTAWEADALVSGALQLTAREQETPSGRKRRYYHITAAGLRALEEKREQWTAYSKAVTAILAGA